MFRLRFLHSTLAAPRTSTRKTTRKTFRSARLLRFFLLGEVPREQAREHVVAMAEHAEAEVKRLEALRDSIDWTNGDGLFYGRAALEYGLRMNAMEGEWANWLVNKIDQRATK